MILWRSYKHDKGNRKSETKIEKGRTVIDWPKDLISEVLYQPLFKKKTCIYKGKGIIIKEGDTQAQAVVWAAQMIHKLTHRCTQKT